MILLDEPVPNPRGGAKLKMLWLGPYRPYGETHGGVVDSELMRFNPKVVRGFITFSQVAAWVVVAAGLLVLDVTWIAPDSGLGQTLLSQASLRLHSAATCVMAGLALGLRQRSMAGSIALSLLVALSGWRRYTLNTARSRRRCGSCADGATARPRR